MTKKVTYIIGVIIALLIFSLFSQFAKNIDFFPSDNVNKTNKAILISSLEDEPNFSNGMMDNFLKPYLDKDIESRPTKEMLLDATKCFKEKLFADVINSNNTNINIFLFQESEVLSNIQLKKRMNEIFLELDDEVQNIINYCKTDNIELPLKQLSKDQTILPTYTYLQCDVNHSHKVGSFDPDKESSVATVRFGNSLFQSVEIEAVTEWGLFIMNFEPIFDSRDQCDSYNEREILCSSKLSNDLFNHDQMIKLNRISGELFYRDNASTIVDDGLNIQVIGSGFCKKISSNPKF